MNMMSDGMAKQTFRCNIEIGGKKESACS